MYFLKEGESVLKPTRLRSLLPYWSSLGSFVPAVRVDLGVCTKACQKQAYLLGASPHKGPFRYSVREWNLHYVPFERVSVLRSLRRSEGGKYFLIGIEWLHTALKQRLPMGHIAYDHKHQTILCILSLSRTSYNLPCGLYIHIQTDMGFLCS